MHAVINHLKFTDPIDPTSFEEIPSPQEQLTRFPESSGRHG